MATIKEQVHEVLATLSPREQEVLKLRFGLVDGQSQTLKAIGQSFNVTPERIRQIETKALRKLRHPLRSRGLKGFLEEKTYDKWTPEDKLLRAIFRW